MNTHKKFLSAILASSILVAPISGLFSRYDNVAKANSINIEQLSKNTILSHPMNRSELIKYFSKNNNVSYSEAEKSLFQNKIEERYAYSYRIITKYISNGVRIEFYTKGDGWNNYYSIDNILNVSVKHHQYCFNGSLYSNLENNHTIYYDIEGSLVKNGTVSVSGSINIGVGQGASINLGGAYSSNIQAHISDSGRASIY